MIDETATVVRPATVEPSDARRGRDGRARSKRLAFIGPWVEWFRERVGPRVQSAWEKVLPSLSIVSAAGWTALALGASALVVGAMWGWSELTFLGTTLVAAVVLAAAFVAGRSTYRAEIELEPTRVVVGEKALGRLEVRNIGRRNLFPSRIEMPVGAAVAEFGIPALKPDESTDELFAVPTNRRAVVVAGPVVAVRGDQLGLLRRTVRCADEIELFVHPRTARLAPSAAGLLHDLEGHVTRKLSSSDMAFHALRPYVAGDDRRFVHWKSSARTGELMVRQFEETKRSQLTIVLSANERHYASEDEFELAVSVTASIAAQVVRSGNDTSVVSEKLQLSTRSVAQLLDDSCRLHLVSSPFSSSREFAREVTKRLPPPTVLIFVCGSGLPVTDLRAMHALFPLDVRSFAFRAVDGELPAVSAVQGLTVATIGELDALRGLVRAVTRV